MPELPTVPPDVERLAKELAEPTPMRRGSLSERRVKCSKPRCACSKRLEARHGPYYSLTRAVSGRTQSRFLPPDQAPLVRHQIEAGRQFRARVEAYWRACEAWADAQLDVPEAASREAAKKGGSKRPSMRKSRPRLRRS
jgi:hypothetical protein